MGYSEFAGCRQPDNAEAGTEFTRHVAKQDVGREDGETRYRWRVEELTVNV
jgi:hypothetical protein